MRRISVIAVAMLFGSGALVASPAAAVSKPSKPRGVTVVTGVGAVTVAWKQPQTKGGCAIKGYKLQITQGGQVLHSGSFGPGRRDKTVAGLPGRVPLTGTLQARNCKKLGFKVKFAFVPRLAGVAPMGDTAKGTYYLPGGLGGVPNTYEIWKWDPVAFSVATGQRMVYTKIGTLPYQLSYSQAFVYTPLNATTLQMKVDQTTTIGPAHHTFRITAYDANLDQLNYIYDEAYPGAMGGCRHPQVQAEIPWLCVS